MGKLEDIYTLRAVGGEKDGASSKPIGFVSKNGTFEGQQRNWHLLAQY